MSTTNLTTNLTALKTYVERLKTIKEIFMALKGELQDLSVSDLVKIHCIGRARARVKITHNGGSAELYFDNGNIIDAHFENEQGVQAVHRALDLLAGKYQVELNSLPKEQTVQMPWQMILEGWENTLHS